MPCARGPSPRARGIPWHAAGRPSALGSIPASAGNPPTSGPCWRPARVHPRERGESLDVQPLQQIARGPSPRARGIPTGSRSAARELGSIPASAGNPSCSATWTPGGRVHPRERGESWGALESGGQISGPSPRARGIHRREHQPRPGPGSIPASAGNPAAAESRGVGETVHPRERGESGNDRGRGAGLRGPSPRARGIPLSAQWVGMQVRSIPASAGNPRATAGSSTRPRVHPRERGESDVREQVVQGPGGPSPRARGIHRRERQPRPNPGSIPASAGNPTRRRRSC